MTKFVAGCCGFLQLSTEDELHLTNHSGVYLLWKDSQLPAVSEGKMGVVKVDGFTVVPCVKAHHPITVKSIDMYERLFTNVGL